MKFRPSALPMILLCAAVAVAPHVPRLPPWVVLWCLAGWGWSLLSAAGRLPRPGRWLLNLLALAGFAGCIASYGFAFNRSVGAAILTVMVGLKPLEARSQRDRMVTAFLLYFLTLTSLLYSDAFYMLPYMLASVLLITALLIRIQDPDAPAAPQLKLAGRIVMVSVPVMVVFFILFPRVSGGFWRLSAPAAARTGFSEEMAPGSISRLVLSREIAFRVEMDGVLVPADKRYWRGLVFSEFDGRTWRPGAEPPAAAVEATGDVVQQIELEPHQQRRLFALDRPVSASGPGTLLADGTLLAASRIENRIRYRAVSTMTPAARPLHPGERQSALQLPALGNPAARNLAARWRREAAGPDGFVDLALNYFRSQGFVYSRTPPLLGIDPVDSFLFDTRRGFCEHYASALAFLLRAAGIPARVVAGYLGGEKNPFGGYLIVRQSDAHAWVEAWIAERGWVRVDPTAVVAPERAGGGTDAALPPEERIRVQPFAQLPLLGDALRGVAFGWDAVNTFWNRQVLGYTATKQRRLLSRIGIFGASWWGAAAAFAGGLIVVVAGLMYFSRRPASPQRAKADEVQRAYLTLCRKLARVGMPRSPDQGPLAYFESVAKRRPDLAAPLLPVFSSYIQLRYGGSAPEGQRARFLRSVRRFSPRKG